MKKTVTSIVSFLVFLALLGAAADTFVTAKLVVQQTSNLAAATASSLALTGAGTSPLITQCNGSPPSGATAKGSMCLDPTNAAPWVYNGTSWGSVGGGGYAGSWTAGTYSAGAITSVASNFGGCPWLFAATTSTSIQPCYDMSDVTGILWARNGVHDTANGVVTLIAGTTSTACNMVFKSSKAGWDHKRIAVDVTIQGGADGFDFGIYDASLTTAPAGAPSSIAGAWGVDLDFFNSRIYPFVNGVSNFGAAIPAGNINNTTDPSNGGPNGTGGYQDRWYLDIKDNGGSPDTMTMTVYRNLYSGLNTAPYSGTGTGPVVDGLQFWASFTVNAPAFTNWVPIVGAHSGGISSTQVIRRVFVRDTSADWKVIGAIPDRI